MTKAEYLAKLQEKLERFGQELQEDILEDYRQHFAEGENEGKTEEEIIEELGNIEDMIRELSEEELNENLNENPGWKQEMKIGLEKIAQSMPEAGSELSNSLKRLVQKMPGVQIYQSGGQNENQERNQDGGWDRSDSKSEREEYAESAEGCRVLVLDGEVADITVAASEDNRIHVQYENNSRGKNKLRYEFYQYEEGDVFHAGVRRRREEDAEDERGREEKFKVTLFGTTIISYGNMSGFHAGDCEISLHVEVPRDMKRIEVKSKSGDISITDISSDSLRVSSASGDLKLSSVSVNNLEARMASGDVDIKEGEMKEVRISTASGDITGEGMSVDRGDFSAASGDISLDGARVLAAGFSTGSGDIELQNGYFRTIGCHTGSGDIDLHTMADEYECNAGSGDVSIIAESEPKRIVMHTGSGDVDLELKSAEGMEVTVGTMGGEVDINWKGEHRGAVKRGTYTFGRGGCKVNAKSGSGDIQINAR